MFRLLALLAIVSTPALFADSVVVYGTGSEPNGVVDFHFTVTSNSGNGNPKAAYVTPLSAVYGNNWYADSTSSSWISPTRAGTRSFPDTASFDYTTTFDLSGLDPNTYVLFGQIAADDQATILLNGQVVGVDQDSQAWNHFMDFTIGSGFLPGVNTLTFDVANTGGGATGLNVALSGVDTPEPSSVALLGLGILSSLAWARLRSKTRTSKITTA